MDMIKKDPYITREDKASMMWRLIDTDSETLKNLVEPQNFLLSEDEGLSRLDEKTEQFENLTRATPSESS